MNVFLLLIAGLLGYSLGKFKRKYESNPNEKRVANILEMQLDPSREVLVNNVTLRMSNGTTTQIDHVLISTKGVFVIESKHYKGWIFGDEKSSKWTQTIRGRKHQFQSPLRQNYKHVKALEELFDFLPKEAIKSVVVFSGSAEFKTKMPENVVYLNSLVSYLSTFSDNELSLNRVQFCFGRLEFSRLPETKETDLHHIENLQSNVAQLKTNKQFKSDS
ncbi:nuclease-related domain-containing protein [Vibrio parahaemolyticus]|nr:nuclease-related domain-containing protein [Vibrio parahaemolyticus]